MTINVQNCGFDSGHWQGARPKPTVSSVLSDFSLHELIQLNDRLPEELAKRIAELENQAESTNKAITIAREALKSRNT